MSRVQRQLVVPAWRPSAIRFSCQLGAHAMNALAVASRPSPAHDRTSSAAFEVHIGLLLYLYPLAMVLAAREPVARKSESRQALARARNLAKSGRVRAAGQLQLTRKGKTMYVARLLTRHHDPSNRIHQVRPSCGGGRFGSDTVIPRSLARWSCVALALSGQNQVDRGTQPEPHERGARAFTAVAVKTLRSPSVQSTQCSPRASSILLACPVYTCCRAHTRSTLSTRLKVVA